MDILIEEYKENIWAASLKKGRINGLEIDPVDENVRWGSIYWAKVTRIDKAQDAAYLDLDGEHSGILYNRDIRITQENGAIMKGGQHPISKQLSPGDFIAVQAKSAHISGRDDDIWGKEKKSPRVSMDITLHGRYLIYGCFIGKNIISSRIRGKERRTQLENMMNTLEDLQGLILRSAAADMQTEILRRESSILKKTWHEIKKFLQGNEPALIALGPDSVQRILSDKATSSIDRIQIVTMDHFEQIEEWCEVFAPDLVTKIEPVTLKKATQDLALFDHRDVLGQIQSLLQEYVFLPGGCNIIIQMTAAMTVIDVNRGTHTGSHFEINTVAAIEIARQIRLRNIGGIVMVDFINMKKSDEKKLITVMDEETYRDACTVQIHGFTKLGIMEISRKRRTPPLLDRIGEMSF